MAYPKGMSYKIQELLFQMPCDGLKLFFKGKFDLKVASQSLVKYPLEISWGSGQ